MDTSSAQRLASIRTRLELGRIQRHFVAVVSELRATEVTHLSPDQRASRSALVETLAAYGRRGRFPKNLDFAHGYVPYFVDAAGTRCAVAHLAETTGDHELVQRVARSRNNAFVRELASDEELVAWAARAGFTLSELARIQPSYCRTAAEQCFCFFSPAADTGIDGTIVGLGEFPTIRVDTVYGDLSLAKIGDEITTDEGRTLELGDRVIAGIRTAGRIYNVHLIVDGNVVSECGPELTKDDGLSAIMGGGEGRDGQCTSTLIALDEDWASEECTGDSGCQMGRPLDGAPVIVGLCTLALAGWSRRRGIRRK